MRTPLEVDEGEPCAEITQVGRRTYRVVIHHGLMQRGPDMGYGWHVLGRRRAERKGRRELARYLAERAMKRTSITITAGDLS